MTHAYNECYLPRARKTLGTLFDAGMMAMPAEEFLRRFLASPAAAAWEAGEPRYLAAMSGDELFEEITGLPAQPDNHDFEPSAAYWCGEVLCYAQWFYGCSFQKLLNAVTLSELRRQWNTKKDWSLERVVEQYRKAFWPQSALKQWRLRRGLSQSQLALISDVKLRSIRAYEQGDLDIGKAQYDTLTALAQALRCRVEDLIC